MRDSYEVFFSRGYITKEQFFQFGLEETIYAPPDAAAELWQDLKSKIAADQNVFIRSFGRNAGGTKHFLEFYEEVLGKKNITQDPTNNAAPGAIIAKLTGHKKNKTIRNYQISHIFGRTKNIYAFTAPWNIAFVPKMLDPFTGHEAKGDLIAEYQTLFKQRAVDLFRPLIEDFNATMTDQTLCKNIEDYLQKIEETNGMDKKIRAKIKKAILEEFSPIPI